MDRYGITTEEFNHLRLKKVDNLNDREVKVLKAIRKAIPKGDNNTYFRKILSAEDIPKYLGEDGFAEIQGFIAKYDDVSHMEYRKELNMILFENNTGYKKIIIWKDEIPIFCTKQTSLSFNKSVSNTLNWHEGIICVEALLGPWHASNYAMVCMKYSSSKKENVNIIINYGMENTSFQSKVLPTHQIINVGLQLEFAEAIEEFFVDCSMDRLSGGTIEILGGVYDKVGSSNIAFKKVMNILIFLFEHIDQMNTMELKKRIFDYM